MLVLWIQWNRIKHVLFSLHLETIASESTTKPVAKQKEAANSNNILEAIFDVKTKNMNVYTVSNARKIPKSNLYRYIHTIDAKFPDISKATTDELLVCLKLKTNVKSVRQNSSKFVVNFKMTKCVFIVNRRLPSNKSQYPNGIAPNVIRF